VEKQGISWLRKDGNHKADFCCRDRIFLHYQKEANSAKIIINEI
jgi:hypothetical protein